MARHIFRCTKCNAFTMKDIHDCGEKSIPVQPPKYSPEDKYGKYRREYKHEGLIEKGLI